jgi:hypothetical protein
VDWQGVGLQQGLLPVRIVGTGDCLGDIGRLGLGGGGGISACSSQSCIRLGFSSYSRPSKS